jgi:SpoIID/LytB domain protein
MLKAQAVAARTYALYQQMLSATREYDVEATVQDQVYRGKQGIDAGILRAVEDTRGLVVTYQDAPIYAAFSSTAAGLTEDAMNVWSKEYPYLKGVECPFDLASPYYQWKSSFKIDTLEQNLRQQGFSVGTIATMQSCAYFILVENWFFAEKNCEKRSGTPSSPARSLPSNLSAGMWCCPASVRAMPSACASGERKNWLNWAIPFRRFSGITIRVPNCRIWR